MVDCRAGEIGKCRQIDRYIKGPGKVAVDGVKVDRVRAGGCQGIDTGDLGLWVYAAHLERLVEGRNRCGFEFKEVFTVVF